MTFPPVAGSVLKVVGNCLRLQPPVSEAVDGQGEGVEDLAVQVVAEKLLEEAELQEEEEVAPQEARRWLDSLGRPECRV